MPPGRSPISYDPFGIDVEFGGMRRQVFDAVVNIFDVCWKLVIGREAVIHRRNGITQLSELNALLDMNRFVAGFPIAAMDNQD